MSPAASHDDTSKSDTAPRTGLDRLLDVGLYAPLGLLANKADVVQDLATQGRKQVAFSRSLGRAALKAVTAGARANSAKPSSAVPKSSASSPSAEVSGYSSLTAREIIALIPSCSVAQREWIAETERAGKARVTVLRALEGA